MEGSAALQNAMRRRLREAATLNGNNRRVSASMRKMSMTACVYTNLSTRISERNFTTRLLFMATRTYLCERILTYCCNGGRQHPVPPRSILAGCALGNRFARVVLHDNLECADNTLPALFPALERPRQFVDVTTTVVANKEHDAVTTICSAGR